MNENKLSPLDQETLRNEARKQLRELGVDLDSIQPGTEIGVGSLKLMYLFWDAGFIRSNLLRFDPNLGDAASLAPPKQVNS